MGFGLRQVLEELRALRRESEAQRARLDILKQEIDLLKKGQKQQSEEISALREELSSRSREDRENLEQAEAALRGELDRLAGQNGDLEALIRKRTNQLASKSEEQVAGLENLRGEMAQLGDKSGELDALIRKRTNHLASKSEEQVAGLAALQGQLAQLGEKSGDLDALIRKRTNQLASKTDECTVQLEEKLSLLLKDGQRKAYNQISDLKRLLRDDSIIRVLVVTHQDAQNLFIENIVREFVRREYEVAIYAELADEDSIRMFLDMDIPIHPAEELTTEIADEYDFIFCPVQGIRCVMQCNRYVFSYYIMNPAIDPLRGSDFVFSWGGREAYPGNQLFAYMPIGNPKNDTLETSVEDNGRILFLDSGHFPFSEKGKTQVAQMLLDICARFPDREVWVKPRWLPDMDRKSMTHVNTAHLYNHIDALCGGQRPKNLTLLMEHLDLQQLIDSSHCVITTVTTAYLDASLRGKGQLIVRGFDNEDTYQAREWYFNDYYRLMEDTGCVVDVRDVCDYLPDGIPCRPEHLQKTYCYTSGVSGRIVSVMEDICLRFLRKGTYPRFEQYDYETYRDVMEPDPQPTVANLKRRRMYAVVEATLSQKRFISHGLDWTDFNKRQFSLAMKAAPNPNGFRNLSQQVNVEKYQYVIAHAAELGERTIDRAFLYTSLYELGRYEELRELLKDETPNTAKRYYLGLLAHREKDWAEGEIQLTAYLDDCRSRSFLKYHIERNGEKKTAVLALLDCAVHIGKFGVVGRTLPVFREELGINYEDDVLRENIITWIGQAENDPIIRDDEDTLQQLEEIRQEAMLYQKN